MNLISGIRKFLIRVLDTIVCVSFAAMVLCLILQVIFRFVLRISVPWTEELARFLMLWSVFIGAALNFDEDDHIKVDILVSKISNEKVRKVIYYLATSVTFIFIASCIYGGFKLYNLGMRDWATTMPVQMGWIYISLPLGAVMMVVLKILKLFEPRIENK
ncbi:MAG TPA: TRAP transporter small permease [Bacillota bacterium]